MKPRKGCWTCKARRAQCDGGLPTCQKCAQSQRACQGYGLRLSWPKDGDRKRAAIGGSPRAAVSRSQGTNRPFINTTWWDMQTYHHLDLRMQPLHLVQTSQDLWRQPPLGLNNMDLVNHFHSSAHLSLVTFDLKTLQIRDALIRMALANNTTSALALLYALLAFSSLHRSGSNRQAVQFKISALQSLSASAKEGLLTSAEAAQHVAASMLLGAFDIQFPSVSSGEWLWHTQGAVDIVQATCLTNQLHDSDISHLLDWVSYHDTLSRFSVQHWQHKSLARDVHETTYYNPRGIQSPLSVTKHRPALPFPNSAYAILNILSEVCDTLLDAWDPRSHNEEYQDRLKALDRRIGNVSSRLTSANPDADAKLAVEVYQTATRVYLVRASQSPMDMPADLDSLIDMAFVGPLRNCSCPHFFPLFILACEARTDDQRTTILNLMDRAETSALARSKAWLRDTIQSIWVHQDLHADSDLLVNYAGVMSAAISSSNTVPCFV